MSAEDDSEETPAARLKRELLCAGLPVRAVIHDGHGFAVTYDETVTAAHVIAAEPTVAAAYDRLREAERGRRAVSH